MNTKVMFSSKKTEWETPQALFDELNREFGFTLDVCALPENAKCDLFFTPKTDGLSQSLERPYVLDESSVWQRLEGVEKAYRESKQNGTTVVCPLPARTDTRWFHDYIYGKAEIRFLRGRIKFCWSGEFSNVPQSMIVIYRGEKFAFMKDGGKA